MQQYLDLLSEILEHGVDRKGRNATTRGLFTRLLRFDLNDGFPAVTTKKLPFDLVKAELLWFLEMRDRADVKKLQEKGCHIWDANAEADYWIDRGKIEFPGDLGRIYGVQWRSWKTLDGKTVDQLAHVIDSIRQNPYDRRYIVSAWNPGELDDMVLPPCHVFYQFFVADQKLSLTMYQRSCDMFLGVPFNIASYALLLSMVAQVTNLDVGELVLVLGDAHIYHEHFDQVKEQISRTPNSLPTLKLNPSVKDIDSFTMDDIELINYESHPAIKAQMVV